MNTQIPEQPHKTPEQLKSEQQKLDPEMEAMIKSTFYFLVYGAKKTGDNYCVHDVCDNCFDDIEDIHFAVREIIKSAKSHWIAEVRREVEERRRKTQSLSLGVTIEDQYYNDGYNSGMRSFLDLPILEQD